MFHGVLQKMVYRTYTILDENIWSILKEKYISMLLKHSILMNIWLQQIDSHFFPFSAEIWRLCLLLVKRRPWWPWIRWWLLSSPLWWRCSYWPTKSKHFQTWSKCQLWWLLLRLFSVLTMIINPFISVLSILILSSLCKDTRKIF